MKISKKTLAKILTIVVVVIMISTIGGNVFAASKGLTHPDKIPITSTDSFDTVGGKIVGAIQGIGSIVAVGILVVLGIKYMMGSAEEKAEYKKTMIPYLVGAVLVFAASNIAGAVYNFTSSV